MQEIATLTEGSLAKTVLSFAMSNRPRNIVNQLNVEHKKEYHRGRCKPTLMQSRA